MKRRQDVKTLIQNPFPFPLNSPTRRLKLASLFFPFLPIPLPLSTSAMPASVHWRTTNFKAVKTPDWPLFSIRVRSNKDNAKFPKSSCMLYVPMLLWHCPRQTEFYLYGRHLMYRNGKHYMVAHHIVVQHKLIEHCVQRLVSSMHFSKLLFSVFSTPRLSLVSFYVHLRPY